MSVGVWDPGKGDSGKSVDQALLDRLIELAGRTDDSVTEEQLAAASLQNDAWLMSLTANDWSLVKNLDSTSLVALCRLFTLVEQQVSGWEAGNKSPVIVFVCVLKQREEFTPELRKWIKSNTDNRYLPNGSAL